MEYARLGDSGLEVSRITVGCMSWGDGGKARPWTRNEEFAEETIKAALDAGINFFDTANVYSQGTSEEYTGRSLWKHAKREDVVLATKVHGRMRPGPNGAGLSRKAILHEIDASLARLETDYVDLYQIHRWDPDVPIEETMEALHDVVRAGKVRYLGASSMYAWQFAKAQQVAERHGWTKFVSMQNHYNLIYREEEREMIPLCVDQGVGVIPWSPLARGRLTRAWDTTTLAVGDRRVRPVALPGRGRHRRREGAGAGGTARGRARTGRAGLAARPARGDLAHRRNHQARPPDRCRRRGRADPDRRRARGAGRELRAARHCRTPVNADGR